VGTKDAKEAKKIMTRIEGWSKIEVPKLTEALFDAHGKSRTITASFLSYGCPPQALDKKQALELNAALEEQDVD